MRTKTRMLTRPHLHLRSLVLTLGLLFGGALFVNAQQAGPFSAQIQSALRNIANGSGLTVNTLVASTTTGITVQTYLPVVDGSTFTPVLAGAGAGNVDNGVHSYKFTVTDVNGETTAGAATPTVNVVDKTANGKITVRLPRMSNASLISSLKIYRTTAGGSTYLFLTTLSTWVSTYTDNTADSGLGSAPPTTNTAFGLRATFVGENLFPKEGTGFGSNEGAWLLLGDPTATTNGLVGIAAHDAYTRTGNGMELDIWSGGSTFGHGGDLTLNAGASTSSNGGQITINSGAGSSTAASGDVTLASARDINLNPAGGRTIIVNGSSGVSCTVNVPAHLTVVNGIVTLCN